MSDLATNGEKDHPLSESGTIIVTGGAGLIGSATVWALNQRGFNDIIVVDHLESDEKWRNLAPLKFRDYLDRDEFHEIIRTGDPVLGSRVTHVFHLGACSATTEQDAGYLMRNNFGYTRDLAEWSLNSNARFVYASSAATYGDGTEGMEDLGFDIDRLRPLNAYGYSKQVFDQFARRTGLDRVSVGLKYFNIFGPNEHHKGEMRSVVNKAFHQIQESGRIGLFKSYHPDYEDGRQMRDFLYVKDAAEITIHLAESGEAQGLFNVGSGKAQTWLELAEAIFAALGEDPQIEFVEMPEHLKGKYQYYTCAKVAKLRSIGYDREPIPLSESVRDYVVNYLIPGKYLGDE
jgi:ADP-L-glycero-D-manno-heptose 6-epimerase